MHYFDVKISANMNSQEIVQFLKLVILSHILYYVHKQLDKHLSNISYNVF